MSSAARIHAENSAAEIGERWNRFWFEPSHPASVAALRIVAGLATLYYLLSAIPDLITFLGADGLLPNATILRALQQDADISNYRVSILYYFDDPVMLWAFHIFSIAAALAFTAGLFSRVTNVVTLIVVLSWVHRLPLFTWQFEPILTMLLLYLCFAPTGACYSIDRRWKGPPTPSWTATIAVRLIQVHVCMLYVMFALSKLASPVWWLGGGAYLLAAQSEARVVDFTFLRDYLFVINLWTHAIVLFELAFPILIWGRLWRPIMIALSLPIWLGIALLTGLVDFALLMILVNLAFIPGAWLYECCSRSPARGAEAAAVP